MKANKIMAAIGLTLAFGAQAEGTNKVFNGYDVDPTIFDNVVHIIDSNNDTCTGTIVGTRHVLAAAHCVTYNWLGFLARSYEYSRDGNNMFTQAERLTNPVTHPYYYKDTTIPMLPTRAPRDLAIFEIPQEVDATNWFEIQSTPPTQDRMYSIGHDTRNILTQGTQPLTQNNNYPLYSDYTQLSQTVAPGDSGGPNVVEDANGEFKLVGATNWTTCTMVSGNCVTGTKKNHIPAATFFDDNFKFITDNVDEFHYARSQVTDKNGEVTMKIQSLHSRNALIDPEVAQFSLGNNAVSQDYALSGSCTTVGLMAPGETCELTIKNTVNDGKYTEIKLTTDQRIVVNKAGETKGVAKVNRHFLDKNDKQVMFLPGMPTTGPNVPRTNTPSASVTTPHVPSNTPSNTNANNNDGGGGSTGLFFGALLAAASLLRRKFM